MNAVIVSPTTSALDLALAAWLDAKRGRSGSVRTAETYAATLTAFREALHDVGLELDSDPRPVALVLQAWCGRNEPSPATYNQRVSIVSSFYAFAIRRGLVTSTINPADLVERRTVPSYHHVRALDPVQVRARLAAIDCSSMQGLRDYAVLLVALATGRRVSEIASLRWKHVRVSEDRVTLEFPRTKGGKLMQDTLPPATGRVLLQWLQRYYGADLSAVSPEAPLWTALATSPRGQRGAALTPRQIQNICRSRLGVHFHALRHTFAHAMNTVGAPVTLIQSRLGHSNLATTSRYLAALQRAENPYGAQVEALFVTEEPA